MWRNSHMSIYVLYNDRVDTFRNTTQGVRGRNLYDLQFIED